VLLALDWPATTVALVVFFVVRVATGQVFFGSLAIGLSFAGMAIGLHTDSAFGARLPITVLALLLAGFLFWTHRSNLKRHFTARGAANA
jgi:glycerol-3-phosphate acyltransferase PlsY